MRLGDDRMVIIAAHTCMMKRYEEARFAERMSCGYGRIAILDDSSW